MIGKLVSKWKSLAKSADDPGLFLEDHLHLGFNAVLVGEYARRSHHVREGSQGL